MKQSEYLKQQRDEDTSDNDWRPARWEQRINKALRYEKFEEKVIPLLKEKGYKVEAVSNGGFAIYSQKYGKIIYYPGANSSYSHYHKKWFQNQWMWIKYNLLEMSTFDKI
jgi:hypothetical protein